MSADVAREDVQRKWARQLEILSEEATKREHELSSKLQEEQRTATNLQENLILAHTKCNETSSERDHLKDELQEALRATARAKQNVVMVDASKNQVEKKSSQIVQDQAERAARLTTQLNASQADLMRTRNKLEEVTQRAHVAETTMIRHESEAQALRESLSRTRVQKASTISEIAELTSHLKQHQEYLLSLRENQMNLIGKRDAVAIQLRDLKGEKERVLMEMEMERRRASEERLKELSHSRLLLESIKLGADSFSREMSQTDSGGVDSKESPGISKHQNHRDRFQTY
jgi:chromosome segregation ATPase